MCFAKGTYIFEQASSPSLDTSVTIDGRSVLTQHDFPTEISRPIVLDGCVTVRVELRNPLHFHSISFHWGVREAAKAEACDNASFPMTHWNACMFHGRNREEMLERGTWSKLEVPKGRPGGNHGSFDWYSIEARRKVCFEPGSYIFHAKTDETLEVRVREARVLQTSTDRLPPTLESEVVKLAGCQEVTVVHAYRYDTSVLDLAWAKVGSTVDRRWAVERACAFRCREGTTCTKGENLVPPRRGEHICVPTSRPGYEGEYCDAKHPCGPRSGICTVVHGCYQL